MPDSRIRCPLEEVMAFAGPGRIALRERHSWDLLGLAEMLVAENRDAQAQKFLVRVRAAAQPRPGQPAPARALELHAPVTEPAQLLHLPVDFRAPTRPSRVRSRHSLLVVHAASRRAAAASPTRPALLPEACVAAGDGRLAPPRRSRSDPAGWTIEHEVRPAAAKRPVLAPRQRARFGCSRSLLEKLAVSRDLHAILLRMGYAWEHGTWCRGSRKAARAAHRAPRTSG